MDDLQALERRVASEVVAEIGPSEPVDDLAIYTGIVAATESPKSRFGSMFGATKFVVAAVVVALFGGFLLIAQPFGVQDDVPGAASDVPHILYSPTGSLTRVRVGHTATLLSDGRVLVVGGSEDAPATAEVWDPGVSSAWPVAGAFSPAGSLAESIDVRTSTLLRDGRVLVIGYHDAEGDLPSTRASAEVWDPATDTFSPAGSPALPREDHIASLLPDGRVLIVGRDRFVPYSGRPWVPGGEPLTAEIWDPATNTFSTAGSPQDPRSRSAPVAAALSEGHILMVDAGQAWVWDPATDTTGPAASHPVGEPDSTTLLADGQVLVIGGIDPTVAAVWDPATNTFSPAGSLVEPRTGHHATALPDGRVLITGGCFNDGDDCYPGDDVESVEIWDPETEVFSTVGVTRVARGGGTVTALPDGRVLVAGGSRVNGFGEPLDSAEVWDLSRG